MKRQTFLTHLFISVVSWAERLNLVFSMLGNPPVYDKSIFPWTRAIEQEWLAIRTELERVLTRKEDLPGFHELAADVSTISNDSGLEKLHAGGLRLPLHEQHRPVPANLEDLPEWSGSDHCDVVDPRTGETSAAPSWSI